LLTTLAETYINTTGSGPVDVAMFSAPILDFVSKLSELTTAHIAFSSYVEPHVEACMDPSQETSICAPKLFGYMGKLAAESGPEGGFLVDVEAFKHEVYEEFISENMLSMFQSMMSPEADAYYDNLESMILGLDDDDMVMLPPFPFLPWQQVAALSHDGIVAFVDSLPTIEISTIPKDELRCPLCWGDFDAQDGCEGGDVKQVQCCNKRFGRACLIEAIESSTLCPNCRRNFNISAAAHASATA
jgi:hypothetical protein